MRKTCKSEKDPNFIICHFVFGSWKSQTIVSFDISVFAFHVDYNVENNKKRVA